MTAVGLIRPRRRCTRKAGPRCRCTSSAASTTTLARASDVSSGSPTHPSLGALAPWRLTLSPRPRRPGSCPSSLNESKGASGPEPWHNAAWKTCAERRGRRVAASEAFGGGRGDVLIVDDFPDTLALYEAILTDDGHRVGPAPDGLSALKEVEEQEPELVLLDVSMPGIGGVEVLRRLRARRGGGPAVIMLTAARREPQSIEAGLKEGADAYLTKPIDSRELLARVRAALETFRLKRMLDAQRRDHVAMLVHDLRHPLSSLGLIAELLDADDGDPKERRAAVVQIRSMCTEMSRLIDGVLVAIRLEAGVFTSDPSPIRARAVITPMLA